MTSSQPSRTRARPTRPTILRVLAVLALTTTVATGVIAVSPAGFLHHGTSAPTQSAVGPPAQPTRASMVPAGNSDRSPRSLPTSRADEGAVHGAVTVFDDRSPTVANLDPALGSALRKAARDAHDDRVDFVVNSGWRSAAQQEQLLRNAIAEYGSAKEAARWVATPETSAHVSGDAVDLGPSAATSWLAHHGAGYGLCQIYRNEPWHYELRPAAVDHGCPPMYADPTQDPRMQQ